MSSASVNTSTSDTMPLEKSNIALFLELGDYDSTTGQTRMVCVSEFTDTYASLKLGNGGSWCRRSAFEKNYKAYNVKRNGTIHYLWAPTDEETRAVEKERDDYYAANKIKAAKGTDIYLLKIFGKMSTQTSRPIRADIRAAICAKSCIVCGTTETVCDHKNDLYNNPRVLKTDTQTLDDFQPLCNHCNLQKRQVAKKTRETGKRYGATRIAQLSLFGVDFTVGDETFDPADPKAMIGTYWYDPVAFLTELKKRFV